MTGLGQGFNQYYYYYYHHHHHHCYFCFFSLRSFCCSMCMHACTLLLCIHYYYYYYHHHYHHHPLSLLHSSLDGSQHSTGLTDQALVILSSVRNLLNIWHVLLLLLLCSANGQRQTAILNYEISTMWAM